MEKNDKYLPRLLEVYRKEIIAKMKEKLGYTNTMAVPHLVKIVVNMGVGEGTNDPKVTEKCAEELAMITGQKAKICRARKFISNFKLKKNAPIGCCVTLRGSRMYEFLDRLITITTPRIRDFHGFSSKSFDGRGNYTFGLTEQSVFPEIAMDKVTRTQGMNITVCTSAKTDKEALELLKLIGFPFRR